MFTIGISKTKNTQQCFTKTAQLLLKKPDLDYVVELHFLKSPIGRFFSRINSAKILTAISAGVWL